MGPKKGGQQAAGKRKGASSNAAGNDHDAEQDERLQAIVLSDSYQTRFRPLTLEKPRCLLSLCNTPLIEYTFEFLALAGVSEVIVVSCAHAEQIQEYIANSRWSSPSSPFTIETVLSPESMSVGDAMRDLDAKGLITSDFLLVSGDIVCNVPFDQVLAEHRQRRAKDKNAIMTMVLREASPLHRTRARAESAIFVLDEQTNQCLHYEEIKTRKHMKKISLEPEIFNKHTDLAIRNDFIDCHIDICSPDVPALFTENFDYNHIRKDFVHGILTSDLLGKTIFAHVVTDHYAARVRSLQTYDAVSKDVISRWTYPITPDSNLLADQTFQYQRGHIYKEDDVVLARSCRINSCTVIGARTVVDDGAVITGSVIGRRCKIGKNAKISGAYIWDDVTIGDNAVVDCAVIGDGAIIGESSHISPGAIISYNVKVGKGITVDGNKRLTRTEGDFGRDTDYEAVGTDGIGFVYEDESEVEEDDDYEEIVNSSGLIYNMASLNQSDASFTSSGEGTTARKARRRRISTASNNTAASEESDEESFMREAQASVERAMTEDHDIDIAALELGTLRMAKNAPFHEVRAATITALISRVSNLINSNTMKARQAVEHVLNRWAKLFRRQVFDLADQVDLLLLIQRDCTRRMQGSAILLHAINNLYDQDILEESAIMQWWYKEPQSKGDADMIKVGELVPRWLEWLTTAEEESEDDDDE
ncbi:translation initiation factor eIF-2B subunit epsilon [Myxozyma melibiosi]|uniref:Translation initiation factor eIF2B subunit epsilon n=1 Tax=Myxozyma melibiosi TaxID=54550 RepID=A0ABR1FEL1_9ASCO